MKGMSTRWSPCTWPISRLARRYSVPPKRCDPAMTSGSSRMAEAIFSAAPGTDTPTSSRAAFSPPPLDGDNWARVMRCRSLKMRELDVRVRINFCQPSDEPPQPEQHSATKNDRQARRIGPRRIDIPAHAKQRPQQQRTRAKILHDLRGLHGKLRQFLALRWRGKRVELLLR